MSWRERAACADPDVDPNMWFSGTPRLRREAIRICGSCPVDQECLTEALTWSKTDDPVGIRGGYTANERANMPRQHSRRCRNCNVRLPDDAQAHRVFCTQKCGAEFRHVVQGKVTA